MSGAAMRLPAAVTFDACTALALALPGLIAANPADLCLDASRVRRFDSSAIALLLQARRLAQAQGRTLAFLGLPRGLLDLARLYGVESLLAPAPEPAPGTHGA